MNPKSEGQPVPLLHEAIKKVTSTKAQKPNKRVLNLYFIRYYIVA